MTDNPIHNLEKNMRKRIPLPTQKRLSELLYYEAATGKLYWKPRKDDAAFNKRLAGQPAFAWKIKGYYRGKIDGEIYMAHRVIFKLVFDQEPEQIDHINHDRGDNRICNLRVADNYINKRNSGIYSNNTSGANGVVFDKVLNKWKAQIWKGGRKGGRMIYLGMFQTVEEAAKARREANISFDYHQNHGAQNV